MIAKVLFFTLVLGGVSNGAASAATTTLNAVINSGTLTIANSNTATISAVSLEGTTQVSTGSIGPVTVTDNRGTGSGWSVTASVSDFACCTPQRVIAAENLEISPGAAVVLSGKNTGIATGSVHKFTSTEDAATLITAVAGAGMGSYRVTPSISLSIPPDAYAGTYTATVTITII